MTRDLVDVIAATLRSIKEPMGFGAKAEVVLEAIERHNEAKIRFGGRPPETVEEAASVVASWMRDSDLAYLRSPGRSADGLVSEAHHGLGREIRNGWGLWHGGPLVEHCKERFGVFHADDVSVLVMLAAFASIRDEKPDLEAAAERQKAHWKMMEGVK